MHLTSSLRRNSSTSSDSEGIHGNSRFMEGLRSDRRRHSDDDKFSRDARRIFRVLTERDPRLTTEQGIRRLFDEVDSGNVQTQEELFERMFNIAEIEENIQQSAATTPEDENLFVEHLRCTVEGMGKPQLEDRNGQRTHKSVVILSCILTILCALFKKESYFITDNNWEPYINFAFSLLAFILAVGAADKHLPYCCLACGISTFFAMTTFVSLADANDRYALFGVFANMMSCLPTILSRMRFAAGSWRIWRPLVHFRIGYMAVNLGIPSICLLSIPIVYFLMATRTKTWPEAAHSVVPHIYVDLILTCSVISLLFFPTLAAAVVVLSVVAIQIQSAIDLNRGKFIFQVSWAKATFTLFVLVSPFVVIKCYNFITHRFKLGASLSYSERRKWIMFFIYFSSLLMAISFLYEGQMTFDPATDVTNMTWTHYDRYCSMSSSNTIENQIHCSQLKGTSINWKGTVQSVRVVNIDNSFETLLAYLPESISQTMSANECSLTEHNVYTFEIEVSGPYGERIVSSAKGQLVLSASHVFYEMLRLVDEGDVIRFIAFFDQYPVFRYPPRLKLLQLECLNCKQVLFFIL
ncbi:unnamed protein product [Angiostrongylus costaricensis]|uniref:EF-hand domain-containing protein n=1 Tax=Angiostrongylus costaricensis TaxID=334426 RepID=A0A0R3PES2_ANGCS|nr:unnamed protein product [Angiostrongylus costaricensis]